MRTLAVAVVTGLAALLVAGTATAAPSYSLVWTGQAGSQAAPDSGSLTNAAVGDTLTVDVIVNIDATGFTGAQWDLLGVGVTATSNSLVAGAGGPPECPQPPNLAPGTCFSPSFKTYTPLSVGVIDSGSDTTGYDVAGLTPEFTPGTMVVGRGVFIVSSAAGSVSTDYLGGLGGLTDGSFTQIIPAVETVTFVPEPGTAGLMGLGLVGLALAGRRRS